MLMNTVEHGYNEFIGTRILSYSVHVYKLHSSVLLGDTCYIISDSSLYPSSPKPCSIV